MKQIGTVIVFFILLFAFAKWGPAIPFSVLTQSKGEPMIVTGEGRATAVPDVAKISVGIEYSGNSLVNTQDLVNKKSQALVAELKNLGIEDKDIKTISYNIYPNQDYQKNPPVITGYQISINYEITIRKMEIINEVLTRVTNAGANIVGGINFDLSDEAKEKALTTARAKAIQKAKQNAESLAKSAGITLGRVINVNEYSGIAPKPLLTNEQLPVTGGGSPSNPNIQPGETEINLTVTLSYEVR